jgi:prepilin-type N-terminal cleavage/methylation domain-containing protein
MKRGFSLLEVVLAIGILGVSLPVLLTYMAKSAGNIFSPRSDKGDMRRGFSLLEVVLAIGILGVSLPVLLTYMAESAGETEKRVWEVLLVNAEKNVQNVLNVTPGAPALDADLRAYCGHKSGIFSLADRSDDFDGPVFVLGREAVEVAVNGSVERTIYALCPWDKLKKIPLLDRAHGTVIQSVVLASLGSPALKEK